jgi:hypothetical protein
MACHDAELAEPKEAHNGDPFIALGHERPIQKDQQGRSRHPSSQRLRVPPGRRKPTRISALPTSHERAKKLLPGCRSFRKKSLTELLVGKMRSAFFREWRGKIDLFICYKTNIGQGYLRT